MSDVEYVRKHKEALPVLALCYDFDKTLSPTDMQAQGYIQSVGYDVPDFWKQSNDLATDNEMDQNLAYMYVMKQASAGKVLFTKKTLAEYGAKVKLFPGVKEWFERIRKYGKENGVIVEHYIISSGLKEMIEGTSVAKAGVFEKIYASSFYYDKDGVAVWPAQVVNYTGKTQFLFRIEKGVLDINDPGVNESFSPEELRVPFRNIVYIGDSDTDIPCMKLVNSYGGHSIGVYDADTADKAKVYKMMRDGRIKYYAAADYREGHELDLLVKAIIKRTAANEALEAIHYKNKQERITADKQCGDTDRRRGDFIIALEESFNFANTHAVIQSLQEVPLEEWTPGEKESLLRIALENTQVRYILQDPDVKDFYLHILRTLQNSSPNSENVRKLLHPDS